MAHAIESTTIGRPVVSSTDKTHALLEWSRRLFGAETFSRILRQAVYWLSPVVAIGIIAALLLDARCNAPGTTLGTRHLAL
jgi:hypothetical protein